MKSPLTTGAIAGAMLAFLTAPAAAQPSAVSFKDVAASAGLAAPVIKTGARVGRSKGLGIGLGLGLGTKVGIGTGHKNGLKLGVGADVGAKIGNSRNKGLDIGIGVGTKVKVGKSKKRRRW